jgi:hypothetical protein
MKKRTYVSLLIGMMVNAVLFGIGAVTVLTVPSLQQHASTWLPVVIIASFLMSPFISWALAPRLSAKWEREHPNTVL